MNETIEVRMDSVGRDKVVNDLKGIKEEIKVLNKFTSAMSKIRPVADFESINRLRNYKKQLNAVRDGYDGLFRALAMPLKFMKILNQNGIKFKTIGGRIINAIRMMTHGFKGFKMEMLSVMFFGMGMKRFFMGLITPALEMVGVFDIFRTALAILFLPLAMEVLDWALKFLDWVLNMTPEFQNFLNWVAAGGVVLGQLLYFIGAIALGLGGFILLISPLIALLISFGSSILNLLPGWAQLTAAFAGVAFVPKLFDWIKETGQKVWDVIIGMVGEFIQLNAVQDILEELGIEGDTFAEVWENIKEKLKTTLGETWNQFVEFGKKIKEFLIGIPDTEQTITGAVRFEGNKKFIDKLSGIPLPADYLGKTVITHGKAGILTPFIQMFDTFKKKITEKGGFKDSIDEMIKALNKINDFILGKNFNETMSRLNLFLDVINGILNVLNQIIDANAKWRASGNIIVSQGTSGIPEVLKIISVNPQISKQLGGYIPHTGMYKLHAGESVQPAGSNTINFSPNITVSATSNVDIEYLKRQLTSSLMNELNALTRTRG